MPSPHLEESMTSPSIVDGASAAPGPLAAVPPGHPRAPTVRWQDRPAPIWALAALLGLILVLPAWMLWDELRAFIVFADDFTYVAEARDWPTTRAHLVEPHNAHIIPIFRLWTFALMALAGRLESLPTVLAVASYLAWVVAMLALGGLVARETRQPAVALGAMAFLGLSGVLRQAVNWYSATQALWAGTAMVVTVLLARGWAEHGGRARFAAVALAALAAPAIWSGGLTAGPAAAAYIAVKRPSRARGAALLLVVIALAAAAIIVVAARLYLVTTGAVWKGQRGLWPRPVQGLLHTAQTLVEVCFLGNLGLEATTTPGQAIAILAGLIAVHALSRGGWRRINPLEAAGATIAVGGGLIEYTFRGNMPYESARILGWYHAIPQLGTLLFAAGWWTAVFPVRPGRISRGQALAVLGLIVGLCVAHLPRTQRILLAGAPPFAPGEEPAFPTTELRVARARYYKAEARERQVRTLTRLDRLDRILASIGASPDDLRDLFGRVLIAGMSIEDHRTDTFSLLVPRPRNAQALRALASNRAKISELLQPEPEPVPSWLAPADPTSRADRKITKRPPDRPDARRER
jgi:hypothetical protein